MCKVSVDGGSKSVEMHRKAALLAMPVGAGDLSTSGDWRLGFKRARSSLKLDCDQGIGWIWLSD
jgi:hypothetical protein